MIGPARSKAGPDPLTGAFHKVSLKHLQRYLNEFSFRFNNRKAADLFGTTVARMANVG
jgi:ISXO2-like transposase domain